PGSTARRAPTTGCSTTCIRSSTPGDAASSVVRCVIAKGASWSLLRKRCDSPRSTSWEPTSLRDDPDVIGRRRLCPSSMQFRRFIDAAQRGLGRLELGPGGLATLLFGAVALVGAVAVFGGATEDVTQHNGLAVHDAANLRAFTDHRTAWLVSL